MGKLWTWIKDHAAWIGGGIIAVIVAWYLLLRPQSSSAAPTSVSFPASGGSSGGTSGLPSSAPDGTPCISGGVWGVYQSGVCVTPTAPPPPAPPPPNPTPPSIANIVAGVVPGDLATIWNEYGWEASSNPTAYGQGWVSSAAALFNIPTGVAAAAWNAINLNPGQYVSQFGQVDSTTATNNLVALLNGLIAQYNANPAAFPSNLALAPYKAPPPPANTPAAPPNTTHVPGLNIPVPPGTLGNR